VYKPGLGFLSFCVNIIHKILQNILLGHSNQRCITQGHFLFFLWLQQCEDVDTVSENGMIRNILPIMFADEKPM